MKTKLLLLLVLANFSIYAQTNLVPNGNFETWSSSSQPDSWYRYFSGFISQSTTAQNGASSTNMMVASGTFNYINSEYFPVTANKTYRVTMYHKLVKGTFSKLDFSIYHKPGTFKEEITKKTETVFSTSEWKKIEFEYTPTVSENIEVDIWTTGSLDSEILVDNISVVDIADIPVQYTAIPDPEFEKYLSYIGLDKDGINGKVLTSNIAEVKSFEAPYSTFKITDLTGIQDFTALESLTYKGTGGKLAAIDVSKNLMLKKLDLSSNQLASLDVSYNKELESLICGTNKLTTLDVSQNTQLKTLKVDSNQLTAISIADNKELTEFNCRSNKITNLDLTGQASLITLSCAGNPITELELSKNVLLKNLSCQNAKLTQLNLSKNTQLEVITADNNELTSLNVSAQPNLKGLDCYRNKITSLDISNNPLLVSLNCYYNSIKQLNLSNNRELTYLDCLSNSIASLDVSKNTKLTVLAAHYNNISKIDVSKNLLLDRLSLGYNQLTEIDITNNILLTSFDAGNNSIRTMDLSKNKELAFLTLEGTKIESLDLSNNSKLVFAKLGSNKLLYDLNLKNIKNATDSFYLTGNLVLTCILVDNKADADTWKAPKDNWAKYSEDCRAYTAIPDANFEDKLIDLNIDIDGKNGQVLTSSIAKIKSLDVSKSSIVNLAGIEDFASLETLNCNDNQLLFLDLSKNNFLTSLNASNNKLVTLDLKNGKNTLLNKSALSFTGNANLKCIQVDDENYSNTNWATLKDAAANYNTSCNSFTLIPDSNFEDKLIDLGIDVDGKNGKTLTSSISSITTLDLSESAIANATGIEGFTALQELDFSSNQLKGIDLTKNISLTTLHINDNQLLNLDLSKNTALVEVNCANNNLFSLNLKNGNNSKLTGGRFLDNPKLTCIQVDDKSYSDTKWPNLKQATSSYEVNCDGNSFTLIPDANFENKLIARGIDTDGFNGGVLTSSISSLKELNLGESSNIQTNPIQDLTGIQDFKALEKLNVSYNRLVELDLSNNTALIELSCAGNRLSKINISKNALLTTLECGNNYLTEIDFSKNTALFTVNCQENKLTSLDFSKNPNFYYLYAPNNKLTSLDLTKNPNLNYLSCGNNQLTSLDVSNNKYIMYLFCQGNKLKSLDISKVTSLSQFGCDDNLLTSIDVSKNTSLSHFRCSNNQLTSLDLTNNLKLYTFNCQQNNLTTLNLSKNKTVGEINCSSNKLVSLNIKNGNNSKLIGLDNSYSVDFKNNPDLTCIQVDDVTFANANMSNQKDATASYNTNCGISIALPGDNFTVETKGESCLGENNGEINIAAKAAYQYEALISGKSYSFTNNMLKITNLDPGTYSVSISIVDESFEQNFNITIAKGLATAGSSNTTGKKVNVEITEGTAPYTVFVDGTEQFQTTDSNFSLDLNQSGLLEVATAKACEGLYSKKIAITDILGTLAAYPNPTLGNFEIEIPTDKTEVTIELYNFGGQLVSTGNYLIDNGKAQLNLSNQPSGIYAAKIYLSTPQFLKIIKK